MQIEIKKRYAIAIMILLSVGLVMAYGGSSPSTFGHSAGEVDGAVPSGFCIFTASATSCPDGFSAASKFDKNAIRGLDPSQYSTAEWSGLVGATGGKETHNHAISNWRSQTSGSAGGARTESNWPPYVNVLVCCKT